MTSSSDFGLNTLGFQTWLYLLLTVRFGANDIYNIYSLLFLSLPHLSNGYPNILPSIIRTEMNHIHNASHDPSNNPVVSP